MQKEALQAEITRLIDELRSKSAGLMESRAADAKQADGILTALNHLSEKVSVLKHLMSESIEAIREPSAATPSSKPAIPEVEVHAAEVQDIAEKHEPAAKKQRPAGLVEDRLRKMKIADLYTTIGINEKYQFISVLFAGNADTYNEAIRRLNEALDKNRADALLNEFQRTLRWDEENDTVIHFIELVSRRFA